MRQGLEAQLRLGREAQSKQDDAQRQAAALLDGLRTQVREALYIYIYIYIYLYIYIYIYRYSLACLRAQPVQ